MFIIKCVIIILHRFLIIVMIIITGQFKEF